MINQQLLAYIKQQLAEGTSKEDIKKALFQSNWTSEDIDEAFMALRTTDTPSAPDPMPVSESTRPAVAQGAVNTSFYGVLTLLSKAWNLYKRRFLTLVGVALTPSLAMILVGTVFAIGSTSVFSPGLFVLLAIVTVPLALVVALWGQVSMLYAIRDDRMGIIESYRKGWRKILSYLWVLILVSFVTIGGFILLFVPGVIFSIWFIFASFVLVLEDITGMDALIKSKEYVRGRWWGTFRRLIAVGIIGLITYAVIGWVTILLGLPGKSPISKAIDLVASAVLSPFFTVYMYLLYENLKEIRGEFVFEPKGKAKFVVFGIMGSLIIPIILLILLSSIFLASLSGARGRAQDSLHRSGKTNNLIQQDH